MEKAAPSLIVGFNMGVYDMFHVGHLNIISQARARCDQLIVGVHSDAVVAQYKPRQPVICQEDRLRIVSALRDVDQAVINPTRDIMALWEIHRFHRLFAGDDWKGTPRWTEIEKQMEPVGCHVIYLPYTQGISTTQIYQRLVTLLGDSE